MPSLTLKNIPDGMLRALREAADRDRRSLTQEIFHLLETALVRPVASVPLDRTTAEALLEAWRDLAAKAEASAGRETEASQPPERRPSPRDVDLL